MLCCFLYSPVQHCIFDLHSVYGQLCGYCSRSFSSAFMPTQVFSILFLLLAFLHKWGEGNGTPLQYSCLENPMDGGAWWAAVHRVTKSRTGLSDFTFTFYFHALEKETATHSTVLAWRIPGTGEPGGLPSMGSQSQTRLKRLSTVSEPVYTCPTSLLIKVTIRLLILFAKELTLYIIKKLASYTT